MKRLPFHFHRIPVGIDNCYLLRGRKTVLIILTHGHADHIGSLHEIQKWTGARIAVHQADCHWVESGQPDLPPGVTLWGRALIGLATYLYKPKIVLCRVNYAFDDDGFSLVEYGIPGSV